MTRRLLPVLATVATALVAPPVVAAGCTGVHRSGHWATIDYPPNAGGAVAVAPGAGRGGADLLFVVGTPHDAAGRPVPTILRSDDGGCSWATVYTLDTLTPSTAEYVSPTATIMSFAVAAKRGPSGAVVYATTGDNSATLSVAPPVVTLVSADSGKTWTKHVPAPADLATDVPRCVTTVVSAGPDPATAYLYCQGASLIEQFALLPYRCSYSFYVTHDFAKTWVPLAPGYGDPAKVAPDGTTLQRQFGCGPAAQGTAPDVDRRVPGLVWDVRRTTPDNLVKQVTRSSDGGKTWTPLGPLVPGNVSTFQAVLRRDGVPVLIAGDGTAHVWTAVGGGPWTVLPEIKVPSSQKGVVTATALRGDGTPTVLADYSDGTGNQRLFAFDVGASRGWRELPPPPRRAGGKPAWGAYAGARFVTDTGAKSVYVWLWSENGPIYRYTP